MSIIDANKTPISDLEKQLGISPAPEAAAPVQLIRMSTVTSRPVKWLWDGRIPLGMLTDVQGDPGIGKSTSMTAIGAAITLGHGLPGMGIFEPGNVLHASAEDALEEVLKPRLEAMEADCNRYFSLKGCFNLDEDSCQLLEARIQEVNARLVLLDPLVAYLCGNVDLNRSNHVRQVSQRLALLAEKYQCAIVTIRHLTKGGTTKAIYRGIGSIDILAAARSVLLAGEDPDSGRKAICHIKCNVAPKAEPIGYQLMPSFNWMAETSVTVTQILSGGDEGGSELEKAKSFLSERLCQGQVLAAELYDDSSANGISRATLLRAKDALSVRAEKSGGTGKRGSAQWYWKLPENEEINV